MSSDRIAIQRIKEQVEVDSQETGLRVRLSPSEGTTLPPEVFELRHLESLECVYSGLTELPPEIGQLTNLKRLILTGNRLTSLPPEIGQLIWLEELDLMDNDLAEIPSGIQAHKRLNLRGNRLTSLPAWKSPPTRGTLDLAENELAALPAEGAWLSQVTELDVSGNRLQEIRAEAILPHEEPKLSARQLRWLLPKLGRMTLLEVLILRENRLTRLPPELGYLQNLRHLDLRLNQLRELPRGLSRASALERLEIGHNPIERIPHRLLPVVSPRRSRAWYWKWSLRHWLRSGPVAMDDLLGEGPGDEPRFLVAADRPGSGILQYWEPARMYLEADHFDLALPRDLRRRFRAWLYEYGHAEGYYPQDYDFEGSNQQGRDLARALKAHLDEHPEVPVRVFFCPAEPNDDGEPEEVL